MTENDFKEILRVVLKALLKLFAIPALIMVIWNWQIVSLGIGSMTYWQAFWLKVMIDLFKDLKDDE